MQPKHSWVARYNKKKNRVPGIYAIYLDGYSSGEDEENPEYEEDDEFIDNSR